MDFDTIFFIGPQGSGKGTQARRLANKLGFFYWEMGGIIREVAREVPADDLDVPTFLRRHAQKA